ncbi:MAG: prepilin-type N-terminal cleavage/methylation domain-containing protein [Nitrospiraceae bacterium]|nr:prepilin-type N-terminal cleavage/methylation domain-containing protein [Nitrospiraceae bacterium]
MKRTYPFLRRAGGNESGFTLIEMIAAITIGAIIFSIAGMWIVSVTNSLLLVKQNSSTALKVQAATLRLEKEFHIITAVSSGSAAQLNYTNNRGGSPANHILAMSGTTIQLDGNTLLDNIASFTLTYSAAYNGTFTSNWAAGDKVINLSFSMTGASGSQSTFSMRVRSGNL